MLPLLSMSKVSFKHYVFVYFRYFWCEQSLADSWTTDCTLFISFVVENLINLKYVDAVFLLLLAPLLNFNLIF